MAITDFFRPKHRHSDAHVRAQAVRELDSDDIELLRQIAGTDRDPEIRRLAVSKIPDADMLLDLVAKETDPSVRREAHVRAGALWSRIVLAEGDDAVEALGRLALLDDQSALVDVVSRTKTPRVRTKALELISDERALADVVRRGPDQEMRRAALERIQDVSVLRSLAMDETRKALGIAAVDRIQTTEVLEQIAAKAKNKHVRGRAKKRAAELAAEPTSTISDQERRDNAERVQLVREMRKLQNTSEWVDSRRRFEEARSRWDELGEGGNDEHRRSFEAACGRYLKRYESEGLAAIERSRAARLAEVEKSRDDVTMTSAQPSVVAPAETQEEKEERRPVAEQVGSDAASDGRATSEEDESRQLEREEARKQREKVATARLEALCVEVEELAEGTRFREIDRKLGATAKTFAKLRLPPGDASDALVCRYDDARKKAIIHSKTLREADDWRRWSALPKLQALIAEAEELLESPDVSRLGRRLKSVQQAWKEVGPAPHDKNQELWTRFKETCDRVYDRVREHRETAAAEYAENLAKKTALCEQVEALADSTEWEETAAEIKALQTQWKDIGPVPRKKSKKVWLRFRTACDKFFDRRKPILDERLEELEENFEKKKTICDEIDSLAESSEEWDEISSQLSELRARWRQVGHVPRREYAAITERFRVACDRLYSLRDEAEKARESQTRGEVEALIGKLTSAMESAGVDAGWDDDDVADAGDERAMVSIALELRAAARELEAGQSELRDGARKVIRVAVEASPEAFDGSDLDPRTSRRSRLRLIEQLEELVPGKDAAQSIDEMTPEEVASRLREALASNALGIVSMGARPIAEVLDDVRTSWWLIGPVPGREGIELQERFDRVRQRVIAHYGADDSAE